MPNIDIEHQKYHVFEDLTFLFARMCEEYDIFAY